MASNYRLLLCCALLALGALLGYARAADVQPLNSHVLALVSSYPLDGRHPYSWHPDRHTDGVSQALSWRGTPLGEPDAERSVHCSGITFEVYIQALSRGLRSEGPTSATLLELKEDWYIRQGTRSGPVDALVSRGMGLPIERLGDLQPGDFVQFWRNNGNGHSAIFIEHTRYRSGTPRGMVFWSAQGSSGGLGYRRVSLGEGESQIQPESLYGVRAIAP